MLDEEVVAAAVVGEAAVVLLNSSSYPIDAMLDEKGRENIISSGFWVTRKPRTS